MDKGMQCVANGPKDPMNKNEGWAIDRPGSAKESFGAGPQVSDIH
jgi:hypothetical protein